MQSARMPTGSITSGTYRLGRSNRLESASLRRFAKSQVANLRRRSGMRRWLVAAFIAFFATSAFAQGNSTFNGRVVDNSDAVLPGVTITVTNKATGVVRTTVTNENGQWALPGLEPGTYEVKSDLPGFQSSARDNVNLLVGSTLTVDFKMAVAGVNETLTVTGEAPLIEATQSKMAATIQTTELQNLPMVTRTITGM